MLLMVRAKFGKVRSDYNLKLIGKGPILERLIMDDIVLRTKIIKAIS